MRVKRYFLELNNYQLKDFLIPNSYKIYLDTKKDFNINKFFYKQVGREHYWRDRLIWSDSEWANYVSNKNFET